MKKSYTLSELSEHINAELRGDPKYIITGIASLEKAQEGQISFLKDTKYKKYLTNSQASAIITDSQHADECSQANVLIIKNPYLGYAKIAALFSFQSSRTPGIHPTALIGENCSIAKSAQISAYCVIGDNVRVGEGTIIHAGCVIDAESVIGSDCLLHANVTLYHHVSLGDRVIVHSGVVIGSDGFGMVNDGGKWHKVPQIGGVSIGNDVEIGANTSIDRGAVDDTIIEDGVKLDNLIQIAHNVRIGAHTVVAGCSAIAGSTQIGKYCMIGGKVAISDHVKIADRVILTAGTQIGNNIDLPGIYSSGTPPTTNQTWRKNAVRFLQLDEIARRLRKLEKTSKSRSE